MESERETGMPIPMPIPLTLLAQEGLTEEYHENSNDSSAVGKARKLLFRRMLVGVNDGRFFLGNFHCMDKQGNIILQDTVEFRSIRRASPSPMEQRGLGLILIPSSCRTTCHIDCRVDEQLSLLSPPSPWELPYQQLSVLSLKDN